EVSAAEDLHFAGLTYWTAHNWTDRNSAEGVGGRIVRLPSVALLSDGFTPRYFFGIARQASYQGRVLDARHVTISAAAPTAQLRRALVLIAGIQGSQWEASALNNVFGRKERQGLSATEYLTYAASHNVPIQVIAQENLSAALASLSVSPDVKDDINAAVSTGKIAMIPQRDLNIRGHVGNGYIIVDPETGAGAYLIDGGLNGGLQEPCTGASASPPAAGGGGGGGGGGQSTMLVSLGFMPAGLPAPAEGVTTRIGSLVSSEANMARLAEIGAQAANDAEAFAPRLTPSVTFRLVSTGFVLVVGAAILTAVILAVAYSIAVLFTYHHAQIELALLAAEEGVDTQVEPVAPPQAEPNPDEKDCECEQNPESPQCRECTFVANCPHKGGDEIHNTCADFYTQPQYFGCDVKVTTPEGLEKNFDAMSPDGSLWEVKTRYLGGQNRSPFLAEMELNENYKDALYDSAIAKRCGRPYVFSVGDQPHYDALAGSPARPLIDILHKNQCLLSR
ncbi:MAG TPA: DUF6310 domain-containing protein, partial [Povalibacter sp.]|nr:DUF6310 domain-containing protein [Povalibacter sp.]